MPSEIRIEVRRREEEVKAISVDFEAPGQTGKYINSEELYVHAVIPCSLAIPVPTEAKEYKFYFYDISENLLMTTVLEIYREGVRRCVCVNGKSQYCNRTKMPGCQIIDNKVALYVPELPAGAWTKQDFINALQDKGPIPLEDYPPGGWLRGWSRTEPYMLEYQKGDLTLGIDLEAPGCKDNPPTNIKCVRWRYDWGRLYSHCEFVSDACFLPDYGIYAIKYALNQLYGETEYLACMVISPESSRYVPFGDTVDLKLTVSNCGTKKCKIKGAIKMAGKIFIEEEKSGEKGKITISKELSIVDFVSIGFYASHQENGDWTLDEYKEVSLECIPTQKPTKGSVDIPKSITPKEIYLTKPSTFRIHIENTSDVATRYRITLTFTGIDVSKEYKFTSGWSEILNPTEETKLDVVVLLPEDAIPPGKDEAIYDISTTLEAK